ncbi:uncharacterized protein [Apostichopus japonicus]|uniref:uncharacterized protein isoform X2 n=1 Tax=Stichopus japonicus TaxID=307972 RepID=UPI003AB86B8B
MCSANICTIHKFRRLDWIIARYYRRLHHQYNEGISNKDSKFASNILLDIGIMPSKCVMEVATEGVYEQEDSDQDDSIDQPGDIKKGHSLNDVQKTGVEIANSQRQTEENTMDYSGASSSPPARRSKHCIIKVAWKVSNSELHESGTMSL